MNHTLQFMPCHAISSYETPHIFSSKLPVLDLNPITIYHNHFNVYYVYLDKYTSLKNICDLIHIRIYLKKKKYATISYLFSSLHSELSFKNQLIKPGNI